MIFAVSVLMTTQNHVVLPKSQPSTTELFPAHTLVMKFVETAEVARLFVTLPSFIPVCGASLRLLETRPVRTYDRDVICWHLQSWRNDRESVANLGGLRTYLVTGPDARPPPHPSHFDPVDTVERNLSESIGRHARPDCDPNHEYRDRLYEYRYSDTIRLRRSRHSRIPTPIKDLTHDLLIKPLMRGYANDSHGLALGSMDYERSSLHAGFPERTTSLVVCINTGNDAHLVQQCFVDRTWLKSATTGTPRILPFPKYPCRV